MLFGIGKNIFLFCSMAGLLHKAISSGCAAKEISALQVVV